VVLILLAASQGFLLLSGGGPVRSGRGVMRRGGSWWCRGEDAGASRIRFSDSVDAQTCGPNPSALWWFMQ
jgi:hypothetical protein